MRLREMREGIKVTDSGYENWGTGKITAVDKDGMVEVRYNGNKCRQGNPRGRVIYTTSYDYRYLKQS